MKTSIPKDLCEAILKEMLQKIHIVQSMTCVLCRLCENSGHVERYMLVSVLKESVASPFFN